MLRPRPGGRRFRVPAVSVVVALVAALALSTTLGPRAVAAGTADTMEASILTWVNSARVARGLDPLVVRADLTDLAGDRAAKLAAMGVLSHAAAGCLSCQLDARRIVWHAYGETLASTSYAWGMDAAHSLFDALSGSAPHWALLMSGTFDQIGVGVAYRPANRNSYLSIVLIDGDPQPRTSPARPTRARSLPALIRPDLPSLERRHAIRAWVLRFTNENAWFGNHVWRLTVRI